MMLGKVLFLIENRLLAKRYPSSESFGVRSLLLDAGGRGLIFSLERSIAQESEEKLKSSLEGSLLNLSPKREKKGKERGSQISDRTAGDNPSEFRKARYQLVEHRGCRCQTTRRRFA